MIFNRKNRRKYNVAVVKEAPRNKTREDEMVSDAVNQAMLLTFVLPLEVLLNDYGWKPDDISDFTSRLLKYYEMWQNDELNMDDMKKDLWKYGGIRFEEK